MPDYTYQNLDAPAQEKAVNDTISSINCTLELLSHLPLTESAPLTGGLLETRSAAVGSNDAIGSQDRQNDIPSHPVDLTTLPSHGSAPPTDHGPLPATDKERGLLKDAQLQDTLTSTEEHDAVSEAPTVVPKSSLAENVTTTTSALTVKNLLSLEAEDTEVLNKLDFPPDSSPLSSPPPIISPKSVAQPVVDVSQELPNSSPILPSVAPSSPLGIPLEPVSFDDNPFLTAQQEISALPALLPDLVVSSPVREPAGTVSFPQAKDKKENVKPVKDRSRAEGQSHGSQTLQATTDLAKSSPNHPSAASQQRSNKKIRNPFRSPLLPKTAQSQNESKDISVMAFPDLTVSRPEKRPTTKKGMQSKVKGVGTVAARAAFKPPLFKSGSSVIDKALSTPRSPHPQGLQQRLQLLQRAVKLKQSGEDEKLEELAKKWKDVAKQVAWELWNIVKDGDVDESNDNYSHSTMGPTGDRDGRFGSSGTFAKNWGWDEKEEENQDHEKEDNQAVAVQEEEDPKAEQRTMGLMLRQLGIAHETLGWDEQNEDFVDAE